MAEDKNQPPRGAVGQPNRLVRFAVAGAAIGGLGAARTAVELVRKLEAADAAPAMVQPEHQPGAQAPSNPSQAAQPKQLLQGQIESLVDRERLVKLPGGTVGSLQAQDKQDKPLSFESFIGKVIDSPRDNPNAFITGSAAAGAAAGGLLPIAFAARRRRPVKKENHVSAVQDDGTTMPMHPMV